MWRTENRIAGGHHVVFPWTAVSIAHAGERPIVAEPSRVMFYNEGQRYRRAMLAERGDVCVYFTLDDDSMREIVGEFDPGAEDRPGGPFTRSHGACDARLYYRHHRVFRAARAGMGVDPLALYECVTELVGGAVAMGYEGGSSSEERGGASGASGGAQRDAVVAARSYVTTNYARRLTVDDVAQHVGLSAYHLCRLYKRLTGRTIHQHLTQTRLCAALEPLAEGSEALATLAVSLGFSDQAHFTNQFRRQFGVTPAARGGSLLAVDFRG